MFRKKLTIGLWLLTLMFAVASFGGVNSSAAMQCDSKYSYAWVGKDTKNPFGYPCGNDKKKAEAKTACEKNGNGPCKEWKSTAGIAY